MRNALISRTSLVRVLAFVRSRASHHRAAHSVDVTLTVDRALFSPSLSGGPEASEPVSAAGHFNNYTGRSLVKKQSLAQSLPGPLVFIALAILLLAVSAPCPAAPTPVFGLPSPESFRNSSWSFGEIFTVGAQDLTVTALGAYDDSGDGFITGGGIPVGIFKESDASLLVSTFVQSTDPFSADYRYASITPIVLQSGEQYRVVAVNLDDLYNIDLNFTVNPLVAYNGYGYVETTLLTFGNDFFGSERVWMANLNVEVVPEPSSLALAALGLLGIGCLWRKRA
ncbi:MAG: PEP-CTERM sorting domain-containing protein [Pirellulales bacterium]